MLHAEDEAMKELADKVAKPLSITFRKSGEVPGKLKTENIAPIFKKCNYRSVSLTSMLSKIMK